MLSAMEKVETDDKDRPLVSCEVLMSVWFLISAFVLPIGIHHAN